MSKFVAALVLAFGLFSSVNASAVTVVNNYNAGALSAGANLLGNFTVASGSFVDNIDFTVAPSSLSVGASALNFVLGPYTILNINNLSVQLFSGSASNPGSALSSLTVPGGSYFAKVTGIATGLSGGLYSAAITVTPVTPVPEAETYAMMLAGLGFLGFVARRRKHTAA